MSRQPKNYTINNIRSRFQTVAVDNKYQVYIEPNDTIYNAAAAAGMSKRFVDEDLGLFAIDAVLPGSSFADIEVVGDRQGITERIPFSRIYDDVTFTFLVDRKYNVIKFFESWMKTINPLFGESSAKADNIVATLNYPQNYKCRMSVVKFNKDFFTGNDSDRNALLCYDFLKAWPLSVASTPINYQGVNALKLNVTFRYNRYTMSEVTNATIRKGRKGTSDSFDFWLGNYENNYQTRTRSIKKDNAKTVSRNNTKLSRSELRKLPFNDPRRVAARRNPFVEQGF